MVEVHRQPNESLFRALGLLRHDLVNHDVPMGNRWHWATDYISSPLLSAGHLPALSLANPGNKVRMGIKPLTDIGPFPLKRCAVQQAGYVRLPDAPDRIGHIALPAQ